MSEFPELRPVGTEFEVVMVDNNVERVVTRWRVVGHDNLHGQVVERIEAVHIYRAVKQPIGGSERKTR